MCKWDDLTSVSQHITGSSVILKLTTNIPNIIFFSLVSFKSPSSRPTTNQPTSGNPTPVPVTRQPSSHEPTYIPVTSQPSSHNSNCTLPVGKVRLHAADGQQIQVFEVEVMSSGVNVASSATQSSTLRSFVADRAVDGDEKSFSHTADSNAWLEIDLQSLHDIDSVNIINRYCKDPADSPGCLCRLSNAMLALLDKSGNTLATRSLGDTCNKHTISLFFDEGCTSTSPSVVS